MINANLGKHIDSIVLCTLVLLVIFITRSTLADAAPYHSRSGQLGSLVFAYIIPLTVSAAIGAAAGACIVCLRNHMLEQHGPRPVPLHIPESPTPGEMAVIKTSYGPPFVLAFALPLAGHFLWLRFVEPTAYFDSLGISLSIVSGYIWWSNFFYHGTLTIRPNGEVSISRLLDRNEHAASASTITTTVLSRYPFANNILILQTPSRKLAISVTPMDAVSLRK